MRLILQISGPAAAQMGAGAHHVFDAAGGSIGRSPDNQWVIPSQYISGRHARIHYRDGAFLLEDTSSNGVFLGSRDTRLPRGQQHRLQPGDRFFIDEFEILVAIEPGADAAPDRPAMAVIPEDIFGPAPTQAPAPAPLVPGARDVETDPLKALGLGDAPPPPRPGPRLEDVEGASPLRERVIIPEPAAPPPAPRPAAAPASPPAAAFQIPDDYDPVAEALSPPTPTPTPPPARPRPPATSDTPSPPRRPAPPLRPRIPSAASPVADSPRMPATTRQAPGASPATVAPAANALPAAAAPPAAASPPAVPPPAAAPPAADTAATRTGTQPALDLAALLEAAGVPPGLATPAVAAELGQILRIVVAGVMEVLGAREQIKDEFRIRHTTFKAADNNPLKFSANVEDALYNLLVKRNPAYLGPVDAFDDAFADIRNHQMAMLAGMRVAYEAMLRRFDPERLRERFDAKSARGTLLALPGRMRYWEQFGEHYHDMVKDPEASFRELFGAEFTRAYEEQMLRLRTLSRSQERGA